MLDETALKDRFLQLTGIARELLTGFCEVEQNFCNLDPVIAGLRRCYQLSSQSNDRPGKVMSNDDCQPAKDDISGQIKVRI